MKKTILLAALLCSSSVWAAQCKIDVQNEVHLSGSSVEIHTTSGDTAVMDGSNRLYLHGEQIQLDSSQQQAIQSYRESVSSAVPRAKELAQKGMDVASDLLDDVAASLDAPNAFEGVKQSMKDFFADVESRYYQGEDFVLPANTFESMTQQWQQDFEKAKAMFSQEFFSSAFDAVSEKMKQDGGINLTELGNTMSELTAKFEARLREHEATVEKEGKELCESLDDIVEQEQELHKKIPELKNYQVFTI